MLCPEQLELIMQPTSILISLITQLKSQTPNKYTGSECSSLVLRMLDSQIRLIGSHDLSKLMFKTPNKLSIKMSMWTAALSV